MRQQGVWTSQTKPKKTYFGLKKVPPHLIQQVNPTAIILAKIYFAGPICVKEASFKFLSIYVTYLINNN